MQQFGDIVVRAGPNGEISHLRDVARVELGSDSYALRALLDNKPAIAMPVFQRPGTNALQMADGIKKTMDDLAKDFPQGVHYHIVYDTTAFVNESIDAVVHTLFEALILVVLVVILFLQNWRASIIPLAAVPVSLIGTFAVLLMLGFGLNALTLFGLVLAIGIVVDDAIVVVENVERNIALGLSPQDATRQAMKEVTGPIISTALVLCAVFVPAAFITGLTGQFFRQFAVTIAISTLISAFNSLTLSPALAAVLLRPHDAPKDRFERLIEGGLGWLFGPFNKAFAWMSHSYVGGVSRMLGRSSIALAIYGVLIALTVLTFARTPGGFVPQQDKLYLVAIAQLPDAATIDRTEAVVRQISDIGLKTPGISHAVGFPACRSTAWSTAPTPGRCSSPLDGFDHRKSKAAFGRRPSPSPAGDQKLSAIPDARSSRPSFRRPPVQGLGNLGGFRMQIEDRAGLGPDALYQATQKIIADASKDPTLAGVFSSYQIGVPKIHADIDREKAQAQGVSLTDIFTTMQVYLGSLYVNDFNRFGRTYPVTVQADQRFRLQPEDLLRLQTRNGAGQMIPLGAFVTTHETTGPEQNQRTPTAC